jgi:hypothetical protein
MCYPKTELKPCDGYYERPHAAEAQNRVQDAAGAGACVFTSWVQPKIGRPNYGSRRSWTDGPDRRTSRGGWLSGDGPARRPF